MTHDSIISDNGIERFQDDVEREVTILKSLIPHPRVLEIAVVLAWHADPDEEEQVWLNLALMTARKIREYQECPTRVWPRCNRYVS